MVDKIILPILNNIKKKIEKNKLPAVLANTWRENS